MTAYVIKHQQCPECAKIGNDNSKDNLAIYSDGGEHCFSCGYHIFGNKITAYKNRNIIVEPPAVVLPEDVEMSYPENALAWIEQYELTHNQLMQHRVMWSQERSLLVFPYYHDNHLKAWQGRYFGENKHHPKWITYGKIHAFNYTLGKASPTIIVVEDIISAIKVSRFQQTLPLFGSFLSTTLLLTLRQQWENIIIWLDPDKQKESVEFSKTAALFFNKSQVVLTTKDPKELSYKNIGELIDTKSLNTPTEIPVKTGQL